MSSRFMYLCLFKHSLKVHTPQDASFTYFNHSNPDRYHCTSSAEFCHTAIIPWKRDKEKKKASTNSILGPPRLVPHPFAGVWSRQALQVSPSMNSYFHSLQQAMQTHRSCWDRGSIKWRWATVLLCSLWSPSLKSSHSLQPHFFIANCTTVYLCILHTHRKASAKTRTPKKSSRVNWGRL